MTTAIMPPQRHEAAAYYFSYIDRVPPGDVRTILERQHADVLRVLEAIPDAKGSHRYAPEKWSVSEVVSHLSDTERMLSFRAFWFARGFDTALPSFEQDIAAEHAGAAAHSLRHHVEELGAVRAATVNLFRHLPAQAWERSGIASGNPFTVRALAFIIAGHVEHHLAILRERYGVA
jgi:DinB superfamily